MRTILLIAIGVLILFRAELSSAKQDAKNRLEHWLVTRSELNSDTSKAAVLAKAHTVERSWARLPSLFIGAALLFALLKELARRAPVGYEDDTGFHLLKRRRVSNRRPIIQVRELAAKETAHQISGTNFYAA